MKSKIFTKLSIALTVVLSVGVLMSSCADDFINDIRPSAGDEAKVTFALKLPSTATPKTRALDATAEDKVNTIEIIAFKNDVYSYTTYPMTAISENKFTVKLVKGDFELLVLANSRSVIDALPSLMGNTKQQVLELLEDRITATDKKWDADIASGTYRDIPMASEVFFTEINDGTDFSAGKDGEIKLHRMLAKVDVRLTGLAIANFEMLEVGVFNYNLRGNIVPAYTSGVVVPNVPIQLRDGENSYVQYTMSNSALNYEGEIYLMEAENIHADGITPLAQDKRTCLVVKGRYQGGEYYYRVDFSNNTTFMNILRNHQYLFSITEVSNIGFDSAEEAFLAGPVNMSVEVEAWNDGNMSDVQTNGRHNMGVSQSLFEFTTELSADNKLTVFTNYHGSDLQVSYSTSATDATQSAAWFSNLTKTDDGATSGLKTYTIGFDADQNNGAPRTGYIHLRAGSLYMVVKVNQSDKTNSFLTIGNVSDDIIDAMEFASASGVSPGERIYKVKWAPKAEILYPSVAPVANPAGGTYDLVKWEYYNTESGAINSIGATTIYSSPIDSHTGEVTFTIKPATITNGVDGVDLTANPFYERQQQINFRANSADGIIMRKSVILQQYIYNLRAKAEGFYFANGDSYTFNIKSNRPWKAYLVDNGGGVIASPAVNNTVPFATGGYNLPNGSDIRFKTFDDVSSPTLFVGTGKVRIEWLSGDDPNLPSNWTTAPVLSLESGSRLKLAANSYMVNGPTPINIPTRQVAIAMGFNDKSTTQEATPGYLGMGWITAADYPKLKVDMLWSDIPKALGAADAVVISASYNNKDIKTGNITLTPGTGVGNAVICLYTDNNGNNRYDGGDLIKWSWHIWNAGYYPYDESGVPNTIWMNRNLGATSGKNPGQVNNIDTFGLLYQWGRKDPFMRAATPTSTLHDYKQAYNTAGGNYAWPGWYSAVTVTYTLPNTVNKPTDASDSWSGSSGNTSWGHGSAKSVFDPCPDGYRVPVRVESQNNIAATHHWGYETTSIGNGRWTTYGINWDEKGGYYPAAGTRFSGGLDQIGSRGYYWSASPYSSNAYMLYFNNGTLSPSIPSSSYYAMSIRCVADNY